MHHSFVSFMHSFIHHHSRLGPGLASGTQLSPLFHVPRCRFAHGPPFASRTARRRSALPKSPHGGLRQAGKHVCEPGACHTAQPPESHSSCEAPSRNTRAGIAQLLQITIKDGDARAWCTSHRRRRNAVNLRTVPAHVVDREQLVRWLERALENQDRAVLE